MRYVFFSLMCLMVLFAAVQFNDPAGLMLIVIYSVPALWCALATFSKRILQRAAVRAMLAVCLATALAGVVRFWPLTPQFWTREVWYNVETAREGMGLMIVAGVLLAVFLATRDNLIETIAEPVLEVEEGRDQSAL